MHGFDSAMDADTFTGLLASLKGQPNENRQESATAALRRHWLTVKRLGLILDAFENEITRLEIAKVSAHHVVDPGHALRHSLKFRSSINAAEDTKLMSRH